MVVGSSVIIARHQHFAPASTTQGGTNKKKASPSKEEKRTGGENEGNVVGGRGVKDEQCC